MAEFDVKKTFFIYFIKYKDISKNITILLRFKKKEILFINKVKVFSIILNKKLKFKVYLVNKVEKVTKVVLALRKLKGL